MSSTEERDTCADFLTAVEGLRDPQATFTAHTSSVSAEDWDTGEQAGTEPTA